MTQPHDEDGIPDEVFEPLPFDDDPENDEEDET